MSLAHTSELEGAIVRADHSCWEIVFGYLWYQPDDGLESATHAAMSTMACRTMDAAAQRYIAQHPYRFPTFGLRGIHWCRPCDTDFELQHDFHQRCVPWRRSRWWYHSGTNQFMARPCTLVSDFDSVAFITIAHPRSRACMVGSELGVLYLIGGKVLPDPKTRRYRDFDVVPVQKLEGIKCKRGVPNFANAIVWEGRSYRYMTYLSKTPAKHAWFLITCDVDLDFSDPDAVRIVGQMKESSD
jgi:hypothetical protein